MLGLRSHKFDMTEEVSENLIHSYLPFENVNYRSKEYIARICRDIIEDILKQTYDEENPILSAPLKCSRSSQTDSAKFQYNYNLTVKQQFFKRLLVSLLFYVIASLLYEWLMGLNLENWA